MKVVGETTKLVIRFGCTAVLAVNDCGPKVDVTDI